MHVSTPRFSKAEIATAAEAGGKIVKHKFGGGGGGEFAPVSMREIRFSTGSKIDAILLNGVRHGGGGGGLTDSFRLSTHQQIKDIGYAMDEAHLGTVWIYLTDDTVLRFGTDRKTEEKRLSEELGCTADALRIIALGGWSGNYLDALDAVCVVGYSDSTVAADSQTAIIGAITRGVTLKEYTSTTAKQAESYERALSQTHSVTTNASVSGTYYVTASVETEYSYTWTSQSTMARSIEEQLQEATTIEVKVPDDAYAMLEVTNGKVISPSSDPAHTVFIPSGDTATRYMLVDENTYSNLAGFIDLGGYCDTLPASKVQTRKDDKTGLMTVYIPEQSG